MTWYTAGDEILFAGWEVGNAFVGRGSVGPGPGREFVDEVVACEEEFFGGDLAGGAEGRGMRDGSEAVTEGVEGGVDEIHVDFTLVNIQS